MGRYKMGPNGGYYDPNDSGPDQFTPTPGQQVPGMPQPQAPPQQSGGFQPPIDFPSFPGGGPHQGPWMPRTIPDEELPPEWRSDPNRPPHELQPWNVDMSGDDPPPGYHWEWSGGVTGGKHPVPDGQHDPQVPGQGGPMGPPPDMSGWPRKQYPGGQGGPVPPWMSLGSLGGGLSPEKNYQNPMDPGGWGKPSGQMGSLATLGASGGNVAPKPSGGLAGAIFNKYPDLFGKR